MKNNKCKNWSSIWYVIDQKIRNCKHENTEIVKYGAFWFRYCLDCKLYYLPREIKKLTKEDIGKYVTYIAFEGAEKEVGRIKEYNNDKKIAWVVYKCNND